MDNKLLVLPALVMATSAWAQQTKPNIVFILADDMGYGDVSCLNVDSKIKTKGLDRMASEGVVFTDAHSSSSVSTPTRYGILTGRYNWRSDIKQGVLMGYDGALIHHDRMTMASMLKTQGYQTAAIGKWHLGWDWTFKNKEKKEVDFSKPIKNSPTTLGFDYFYGIIASLDMAPYVYVENEKPTAVPTHKREGTTNFAFAREGWIAPDFEIEQVLPNFVNRACNYIKGKSQTKDPFFLYLALPAPHTPIVPTKEFQGISGLNAYGDFVVMVDAMVDRVNKAIKEAGLEDNTIVVFTTDNGCSPAAHIPELQERGHYPSYIYRGHKADLFDGGHRVPCIMKWPSKLEPHKVNQTVCLTDFFATFANIAGYQLKDNQGEDSFDLTPAIYSTTEVAPIREATIHHSINGEFTIRQGVYKLLVSASSGGWSSPKPSDKELLAKLPPLQLYNMEKDPGEVNNLYPKERKKALQMLSVLRKQIKNGRSTPGAKQKNNNEEHWKQLEKVFQKY